MRRKTLSLCVRRGGFTLVELLLAVFILLIGLTMIACIFPVAADWTRQNAEETVAGIMAKNAVATIQVKYRLADFSAVTTPTVQGLPSFVTRVPLSERAYQFGNAAPWPAANPAGCTYYWTAMIRRSPAASTSGTTTLDSTAPAYNQFDLFVFVFRKGSPDQTFQWNATEVPGCRNSDAANSKTYEPLVPCLRSSNILANVPIGTQGLGMTSGTSFRQLPTASGPVQKPGLLAGESVMYAPPADGTTVSPLIYIYQTTVSF